jgi:hypothetical protein
MQAGGPACRRLPSVITLTELNRCYQAISFTCADPLTDFRLVIQQDNRSGDRGRGRGWPGRRRLMIGRPPSSSGGDPVLKTQLVKVRPREDKCRHLIALV